MKNFFVIFIELLRIRVVWPQIQVFLTASSLLVVGRAVQVCVWCITKVVWPQNQRFSIASWVLVVETAVPVCVWCWIRWQEWRRRQCTLTCLVVRKVNPFCTDLYVEQGVERFFQDRVTRCWSVTMYSAKCCLN